MAVLLSGANMNDSVPLAALLDFVPPWQGRILLSFYTSDNTYRQYTTNIV